MQPSEFVLSPQLMLEESHSSQEKRYSVAIFVPNLETQMRLFEHCDLFLCLRFYTQTNKPKHRMSVNSLIIF